MAKLEGFGRHETPSSVEQPQATIRTPQAVHPLAPTATITKQWPAREPSPSKLPSGPTRENGQ